MRESLLRPSGIHKHHCNNMESNKRCMIEHLVLAGGGMFGWQEYGALRESALEGWWDFKNIRSLWGTSAGSIVAVMICMGFDWETLDDFLLRRPWHTLFPFGFDVVMQGYPNRGFYSLLDFVKVFDPLLGALDMSQDITLKQFHEWTCQKWPPHGRDLYIYAIDINQDYSVDVEFHYKTHPDMPLLHAVYASCSIPGVFSPLLTEEGHCYLDGGVFANFPLLHLLKTGVDPATVFGVNRDSCEHMSQVRITNTSNLVDLYTTFIGKVGERISRCPVENLGAHILAVPTLLGGIKALFQSLASVEKRRELVQSGANAWLQSSMRKMFKEEVLTIDSESLPTTIPETQS